MCAIISGWVSATFVFGSNFGDDVIRDLEEIDVIDLSNVDAITSYRDLTVRHLFEDDGDLVISANGESITLEGISLDDILRDQFEF